MTTTSLSSQRPYYPYYMALGRQFDWHAESLVRKLQSNIDAMGSLALVAIEHRHPECAAELVRAGAAEEGLLDAAEKSGVPGAILLIQLAILDWRHTQRVKDPQTWRSMRKDIWKALDTCGLHADQIEVLLSDAGYGFS